MRYTYAGSGVVPKYTKWSGPDQQQLLGLLDQAASETDDGKRKKITKKALDMLADQVVVYPLVFTQCGTAWDPKVISGVRAQGYPGINLNQAKPGSSA
jgi:peptide/nickel transport system substrate-binding protein